MSDGKSSLKNIKEALDWIFNEPEKPKSIEEIASNIAGEWPSLIPDNFFSPFIVYHLGQYVFHASSSFNSWFTVTKTLEKHITTEFDSGEIKIFHHGVDESLKNHFLFPMNRDEYISREIKAFLEEHEIDLPKTTPIEEQTWSQEQQALDPISLEIKESCEKYGIGFFFHITHLDNLPGIFEHGLVCK